MAAIAAYLNGSTGSDKTGIRKYLNDQGYKDDQIGYSNGNVMLNGKSFYNATPESDGSTYASAGALQNALKQYNSADVSSKANNLNNTMYNNVTAQPFQFKQQQSPFSYDPNSDQAYQAALKSAQANIQTGQNNTLANLLAHGQGNSSYAASAAQQIANKEMGNVSNNILPSLIQQAYQRYQDQNNNDYRTQAANYGVQQDQYRNQSSLAGYLNGLGQQELDNQYRDNAFAETQKQNNIDLAKWGTATYGYGAPKSDAGVFFDQYAGAKTLPVQQFEYGQAQDTIANNRADKQLNASLANMSADNARAISAAAAQKGDKELALKFDIWEKTGLAPEGIPGVAKNTPLAGKNGAGNGVNMNDEVDGLMSSLRGGKLTPELAMQQLEEDFSLGHYTKPQYDQLKSTIVKVSPNYSSPAAALTPEQENDIPSDRELDKMVPKGVPAMDWRSWYKDARGRPAGVSFENWQQLFGPRLEAKR